MMRKIFPALAALLLFAALTAVAGAEAVEQRAFALKDPVTLYAKPDESAKSWEVSLPDEGVKVPSAIRDKDDALWYKVTVDGRTGWLFNEGIRLLMGGKSRVAESVYKRCAGVRSRVMKKPGSAWQEGATTDETDGTLVTYTTEGGAFQALKTPSKCTRTSSAPRSGPRRCGRRRMASATSASSPTSWGTAG